MLEKVLFRAMYLKINIKIDSFNYFSKFKKDWIHTFAFYSLYCTIWQNPTFKCITNAWERDMHKNETNFGGHFVLEILTARREKNLILSFWVFVLIDRPV